MCSLNLWKRYDSSSAKLQSIAPPQGTSFQFLPKHWSLFYCVYYLLGLALRYWLCKYQVFLNEILSHNEETQPRYAYHDAGSIRHRAKGIRKIRYGFSLERYPILHIAGLSSKEQKLPSNFASTHRKDLKQLRKNIEDSWLTKLRRIRTGKAGVVIRYASICPIYCISVRRPMKNMIG